MELWSRTVPATILTAVTASTRRLRLASFAGGTTTICGRPADDKASQDRQRRNAMTSALFISTYQKRKGKEK